jgi:mannosyltransferase OCH1-like enzyme
MKPAIGVVLVVCLSLLMLCVFAYLAYKLSSRQKLGKHSGTLTFVPKMEVKFSPNSRNRLAVIAARNDGSTQTRQYCDKYNMDYLEVPYMQAKNKRVPWMMLFNVLQSNHYDHVLILLDNGVVLNPNSNKPLQTLIRQSGDSDLIACRSAADHSKINSGMLIFKNSEWSQYQCAKAYLKPRNIHNLLMNQVYTPFQYKDLKQAETQVESGLPYMLQCTCVYNEKAFELNHDKKNMYPWTGVQGFVELKRTLLRKQKRTYMPTQRIPKRIYQTMDTTLTSHDCHKLSVRPWKELNPEYEYYFFDAFDRRKLIEKHFDNNVCTAYDMLLPGAYQADLFRYCLLYVYGGCYVDIQTQPFQPLSSVIEADTEFISAKDFGQKYGIFQTFLCCIPEHPAIKITIDEIVSNILKRRYFKSQLKLTGPEALGMGVNKWLGRHHKESVRDGGFPSSVKILKTMFAPEPRVVIYLEDNTEFLLHKFTQNPDQLTSSLMGSIYERTGKEVYATANENKRVYKFALLPKDVTLDDFDPYCLKVYISPFSKVRVGRNEDGGYVIISIPNVRYGLFLSAGVGVDISFEVGFCKMYANVRCLLFDGSVDDLPKGQRDHPNILFEKKNIGPSETTTETNWHSLIDGHDNIFLKMDIEGAEFPWFQTLSHYQLSKFSQIVVEFHWPKKKLHQGVIEAINKTHYLVHFHGNNYAGIIRQRNVLTPRVFECTFLNKKYFSEIPDLNRTPFPTNLDFPDKTGVPDLILDYEPFVYE